MDRWIFWPLIAALGLVFVLALVCGIPGSVSLFLIPISLLGYAGAALVLFLAAVVFAFRKRPRTAASLLLVLIMPALLWRPINWAADCAHLGLSVGLGQLHSAGDNLEIVDWSVGLAGGPNTFLIHDKTDQIAPPVTKTVEASEADAGLRADCAGKVRRLVPHYFVCTL